MKKVIPIIFGIAATLLLASCPAPNNPAKSSEKVADAKEENFGSAVIPGDSGVLTLSKSGEILRMVYANDSTNMDFPIGMNDKGTATLTTKFWMGETEVTNALFAAVYQWAYDNGKFSNVPSDPNGLEISTAKHGGQKLFYVGSFSDIRIKWNYDDSTKTSGKFTVETGYDNHPVNYVTWYGAVMFCNWLTEMRDGNTDNLVYTDIDIDWEFDETTVTISKTGYRLPSSKEWEYAARYRGTDSTNTVDAYTNPYFTKGNSASHATTFYNDNSNSGGEPGKSANDKVAVYGKYWNGSDWVKTGRTETAPVKNLGKDSANTLGLYDMSGNVNEWCSESGILSYSGGNWNDSALFLQIGRTVSASDPAALAARANHHQGFRLSRTDK